jgi:putative toxin-antitoxin system antitoxin component (TIGR02293 family)
MAASSRRPDDRLKRPGEGISTIPARSLGLKCGDIRAVVRQVKSGLSYRAIERFQKASRLSMERIARVVEIPSRTLARRKAAGRLTKAESERLLRLSLVFDKAVGLFEGDVSAAGAWLERPSKALGGESPLSLVETEIGAREVEDLIGRLEHGVFA